MSCVVAALLDSRNFKLCSICTHFICLRLQQIVMSYIKVLCCFCRTRLATLEVELPPHIAARKGSVGRNSGMIALLCALFLSKQGAGEAAEAIEEKKAMEVC